MKKSIGIVLLLCLFCIGQTFAAINGDVNSSGDVNIIDALMVAQYYVGLNPPGFLPVPGDVNCDGIINIIDALLIAQYYVGIIPGLPGCEATPTPGDCPTQTYEMQAETEATWDDGVIESDHSGYTGSGYVNTANSAGRWIEWTVNVAAAGSAICEFTYACASEARPMDLSINGRVIASLGFPASGGWTTWIEQNASVTLNAGTNKIRLTATAGNGAANIDKMDITINGCIITPPPATPTPSPSPTTSSSPTPTGWTPPPKGDKTRVIVTTDGEIDDQCSMVRFLLYSNEFDVEGIIKTSSQYHWQGHNWAGDYWEREIYDAYEKLYPNLILHDPDYPTREYLDSITKLGNVSAEGDMSSETAGSRHIASILMDETDDRPIWLQAWGGPNTIARALKSIKDNHPEKMEAVARKCRFYFIWEQDGTFQSYIRNNWATPYNIPTIISDQFITFGYWWQRWNMPPKPDSYFREPWMKANIFKNMVNNPLIAYYNARTKEKLGGAEAFIGEGDSPSFIHQIPTGLRSTESPDWGGWGGRYVRIRENTWLDKVPVAGYNYPSGRWYTSTGWGKQNYNSAAQGLLEEYFKPITRWIDVIQNDFAARVDWCVESYANANHEPVVLLGHPEDLDAAPGQTVQLSAAGTRDPDNDQLTYKWWQYHEADSVNATVSINNTGSQTGASFTVPNERGKQVHIILEVTDNGAPPLTRYRRVVININ